MIDFVWNLQQESRISEAKRDVSKSKDELSQQKDRVRELEFSVDRLALASQALWELLRSRLGITETELIAKIAEVDLRDGTKDQRMTIKPTPCPKCGQILNTKSSWCIYCGATVAKANVFQ